MHRWADWAELLTLTSPGESLSITEFAETAEQRKDYVESESQDDPEGTRPEVEELIEASMGDPSEFRDALNARAGDVIGYLIDRSSRYGAAYPFEVNRHERIVTLRTLTDSRRLYILLLACASLRYLERRTVQTALTSKFEAVGVQVVRKILPSNSEVHLFGKNSIFSSRYKGLLIDKIRLLAADLGETPKVTENDFEPGDTGDNGLDVVGWVPMGDSLPGRLIVFGQGACTPGWIAKQLSSHADSWDASMTLMVNPLNMVFIPYDYRRPGGVWYIARHIHKSLVIDRYRIMQLLTQGDEPGDTILVDEDILEVIDLGALDAAAGQEAVNL